MDPVQVAEVARSWLRREGRKPYRDYSHERMEHDWELVGSLLCQCPFQADVVWRHHVSWYRTELDFDEFVRLRVIEGPPDESWRDLSPDDTIRGAAERIEADELTGTYEDVDVDYIRRRAVTLRDESDHERLTVFRPSRDRAPYVLDGNHYATARMLDILDGGDFVPQPVYLGMRRDCEFVGVDSTP